MIKLINILSNRYFILFFIIKLIFVIVVMRFDFFKTYDLSMFKGDSLDYLYASKSFVETGTYNFSVHKDGVTEFVYRMPGMAVLLVPLLYLFSFSASIKLFIIIQVLISAYAANKLFKYLKTKFKTKILGVFLFLFMAFGLFMNYYSGLILSETIAQSLFIIISCYLLETKDFRLNLTFMGFCLLFVWLFFLRPFMIVFFPLFLIKITDFSMIRNNFIQTVKRNTHVVVFVSILFVVTGLWTIRNYLITGKPVFMEYSIKPEKIKFMRECTPLIYDYIRHFGGNQYITPYDRNSSHFLWFYPDDRFNNELKRPSDSIFPSIVFSDGISIDSLKHVRSLIDSTLRYKEGSTERAIYFNQFKDAIKRLDNAVLSNTNFLFHLKNRKASFIRFVYQPIQYNMFSFKLVFLNKLLFYSNWFLNLVFITIFILVLCLVTLFNISNLKKYYFLIIPAAFLFLFFVGYYNIKEERELFCYYPAFLIFGFKTIERLSFKTNENPNNGI